MRILASSEQHYKIELTKRSFVVVSALSKGRTLFPTVSAIMKKLKYPKLSTNICISLIFPSCPDIGLKI